MVEITQADLIEILCLEQEIEIIRSEIRKKKAQIAEALASGAILESGPHTVKPDPRGGVRVLPWRGAILRYSDEDESEPVVTHKKAPAKPLLVLVPRSPIEEERAPVA